MEYSLIEEKTISIKIKFMEWNPSYDTIAICDIHNEVLVHRINWQKAIWSKKPFNKNLDIGSLAWCTNGKILLVCYNTGKKVCLFSHEDGSLVYTLILNYEFSLIKWFPLPKDMSSTKIYGENLYMEDYKKVLKAYMPSETYNTMSKVLGNDIIDLYSEYPPFIKSPILPSLPKIGDKIHEKMSKDSEGNNNGMLDNPLCKYSLTQYWTTKFAERDNSLYLVGIVEKNYPCLHIYANALYHLLSIPLHNDLEKICQFTSSPDLQYILFNGISNKLATQNETKGENMHMILIKQKNEKLYLRDDWREINAITRILFGSETMEGILTILGYIGTCIEYLKEIWECVLLEIDSKFSTILEQRFQADYDGPKFCEELLELITWGTASPELCTILTNELKIEELTKIANIMDINYVKIQNVLEKNLKLASLKLVNCVAQLKQFSKWDARFDRLLTSSNKDDFQNVAQNCYDQYIEHAGDFCQKLVKMQEVIRSSAKNFKTFFKWLAKVAHELNESETQITKKEEEISPLSLDEAKEIIDFIYDTFDFEYDPNIKVRVHLDKFGQYLKSDNSEQVKVNEATTLIEQYYILLFRFQELCDSISDTYTKKFAANIEYSPISTDIVLPNKDSSSIHYDMSSQIFYLLTKIDISTLILLKINPINSSCQKTTINISEIIQTPSTICEALIYGQESYAYNISYLTHNEDVKNKCYWINVGLKNEQLEELKGTNETWDISTSTNYHCKNLGSFMAKMMALNVSRKLACLYSPTQGKIQIYEAT